jgi:hypothetical protein
MLEHAYGFNPGGAVIYFIEMEMMDDNSEGDNDTKLLFAIKTVCRQRKAKGILRLCSG